jgi:hypothetical protein
MGTPAVIVGEFGMSLGQVYVPIRNCMSDLFLLSV